MLELIFSFLDLYGEHELLKTNMILTFAIIVILSITSGYFLVKHRFEGSYIKLNSFFIFVLIMYLEMSFSTSEEHYVVTIEKIDVKDLGATIDYCIEQLKKKETFMRLKGSLF